jgi:predicted nucleotidyltransferase
VKNPQDIINKLKQLKPALFKKYNLSALGLFGSVVRDDFSPNSDVDIIIDYHNKMGIEFIDLANYLEDQLEIKVDLVSRRGIKPKYYKEIEKDILYV